MPINSTGTCAHILSKAYRNSYANSIETFHEIRGKIFFSWLIEVWKLNVFKCAYYSFSSLSARLINVQAPLVILGILFMVCTIKFKELFWEKSLILNMRTSNLEKLNLESGWCVCFGVVLGVWEVGECFTKVSMS